MFNDLVFDQAVMVSDGPMFSSTSTTYFLGDADQLILHVTCDNVSADSVTVQIEHSADGINFTPKNVLPELNAQPISSRVENSFIVSDAGASPFAAYARLRVSVAGVSGSASVHIWATGRKAMRLAPAWQPMLGLPDLWAGWTVDNVAGNWQDFARTLPAIAAGDPVASIDDLSGGGHHLFQSTTTKRGTLKANGFSSKVTCTLDGVTQFLQTQDRRTFAGFTIYWVGKLSGNGYLAFVSDAAGFTHGGFYLKSPTPGTGVSSRTGGGSASVDLGFPSGGLVAALYDANDGSGGGMGQEIAGGGTATTATSGGTMNSCKVSVGAAVDGTTPLACELAAMWVYASAHSAGDRALAHATLAAEWGTP